jgi:RecB family exonuclease
MSQPFLKQVAGFIQQKYDNNLQRLCIVLPSRRGAVFLKRYLGEVYGTTTWLPTIISSEEFIETLSNLSVIDEHELVCRLYDSYVAVYGTGAESFDSFLKWGQLILQDFNEIDRYLADARQLYENLRSIKEIENWSLSAEVLTPYQQDYLKFMGSLGAIYQHFKAQLTSEGVSYQGLSYRVASEGDILSRFSSHEHVLFCGFNALNAAELKIFHAFQNGGKATILWDADRYYLDHPKHEAGLFLRGHMEHFGGRATFCGDDFTEQKTIDIVSVPRQMGQAQVMREKLQSLQAEGVNMSDVAVVLANEHLLPAVLMQLPVSIGAVNITMEYPLKFSDVYQFLDALIDIHFSYSKQNRTRKNIYYKDLLNLLRLPVTTDLLKMKRAAIVPHKMIEQLVKGNYIFPEARNLSELFPEINWFNVLFSSSLNPIELCNHLSSLLETLGDWYATELQGRQQLERESTRILLTHFNQLTDLMQRYPAAAGMYALRQMFQLLVGNATVPFVGEPLQGLQIMGVLETRTLDFKHLLLLNVNEGVLPSGRTPHSFLPNDLRRTFGLPLYVEKDAIYAYHFYRLLQRASDVLMTCDSETDTFGKGEQSRFVTQVQLELPKWNSAITVRTKTAISKGTTRSLACDLEIKRSADKIETLKERLSSDGPWGGLSASAIINYNTCHLRYYFRYIARLKEAEEMEETPETNTLGTILHSVLEQLYRPFIGQSLMANELEAALKKAPALIKKAFEAEARQKELRGKAILQAEVAMKQIEKVVHDDLSLLKTLTAKNQTLVVHALEQRFTAPLPIALEGKPHTIYINGTIDRIDVIGNRYRIIDYKSSMKKYDKFSTEDLDVLTTDSNYDKLLQLLVYAWLLDKNKVCAPEQMDLMIIAFRNKYNKSGTPNPNEMTRELLSGIEKLLVDRAESILNTEGVYAGTEDTEQCDYCAYASICFREK